MGGLISLSSMRGVRAPVAGLVAFQTLEVFALQICSPGAFAWILQKSPTAGNVEAVQVPGPNSKTSKKRGALVPPLPGTLLMDQPVTAPASDEGYPQVPVKTHTDSARFILAPNLVWD